MQQVQYSTFANHLKQVSLSEAKAGVSTRLSHTYSSHKHFCKVPPSHMVEHLP